MNSDARGRALITGIRGQDGSYLADLLCEKGYEVLGLTRDPAARFSENLAHLEGRVVLQHSAYDQQALEDVLREFRPTEVYHLAGQSYVGKSWVLVGDTVESVAQIPVRMLESIVRVDSSIRYFQASSSEIFVPTDGKPLTEDSPIDPCTPYGCSKAMAHLMVRAYRLNYGLFAVNGILFPHESPRRDPDFLSRKLVIGALKISSGEESELPLGNLDVARDWGYAPEYVDAMWRMLQADEPQDLVLATGRLRTVRNLVDQVFRVLGMDYRDFVRVDQGLVRAYEVESVHGLPERAREVIGWAAETSVERTLEIMIDAEKNSSGAGR